ncbi:MAG: HD domain-containing protein [Lachnospiraceae bacterium]|nr:HD domain-containing protein [Lachnospiraceae bacterium]
MADYHVLTRELQEEIEQNRREHWQNPYAFSDEDIVRRNPNHDHANLWRPAFVRDVEKIMHVPYYNRYSDKTQVYSFYKNDDISRRALHVQLVARIARNIGNVLGLNESLIEAISLGHDIGHTPFGHAGERILSELYHEHTGRYFNHNVHSARVLDAIIHRNISLQTLDGILCHNGELELQEYRPEPMSTFVEYDKKVEKCYVDETAIGRLTPCTLEGCVMRICDIIAYLGKDRQDATRLRLLPEKAFSAGTIGTSNGEIINNLIVNLIENSYGKPYLKMDEEYFEALRQAKTENYKTIYQNDELNSHYNEQIRPMFGELYEELLSQAESGDKNSIFYRHHIAYVNESNYSDKGDAVPYEEQEKNQLVVDYLASMTDDYFIDLYHYLFPKGTHDVKFVGYFD